VSGECPKCSEHCLDCKCEKLKYKYEHAPMTLEAHIVMELIFWARRYCDGRATFAPNSFNNIYKDIRSKYPDMVRCSDEFDDTLKDKGAYWPYAQDGMYNPDTGAYDARK